MYGLSTAKKVAFVKRSIGVSKITNAKEVERER